MSYFKKIVEKWSHKISKAEPDLKNKNHVFHLENVLLDEGWTWDVINELTRLLEVDIDPDTPVKYKIKYRDGETIQKTTTYANAIKRPKDSEAYKAAVALRGGDKSKEDDKKEPTQKDKPVDAQLAGDRDAEPGDVVKKEKKPNPLRKKDHDTVDRELRLTKVKAKERAKEKGKKGVGAGTAESRAGEAATHHALRQIQDGRDIEEVKAELMEIAKDKGTVLTTAWVEGAIECARYIKEKYGEDIDEIVWDTPSGRELINTEGHGTSSDMFIKLKDGRRVGISLKKDGKVFIVNGGYDKSIKEMSEILKEKGVDVDKFLNGDPDNPDDPGVGIESYRADRRKAFMEGAGELIRAFPVFNAAMGDYIEYDPKSPNFNKIIDHAKAEKDFGPNYEDYLEILGRDEDGWNQMVQKAKEGKLTGDEMKAISKLAKSNSNVREYMSTIYGNMRQAEIDLTGRILKKAQDDSEVREALKEVAVEGIHVDAILGLDENEQLDEFITVYGEEGGAELSPATVVKMFGLEDLYKKLKNAKGDEKKKLAEQIKKQVRSMIKFDFKDGARNGVVKIKHEGPPEQEYPLFTIKARTKPIGTSPALEMGQTTYMVNALKFGLDSDEWPNTQYNNFIKGQIKELKEVLEDTGGVGDGKDISKQIKELESKLR